VVVVATTPAAYLTAAGCRRDRRYRGRGQRFTPSRPCPVCNGHSELGRGHARRCFGFLSSDADYAHCTREELAGDLEQNPASLTYAYWLRGPCRCGGEHSAPIALPDRARRARGAIVATYDCTEDGVQLFQVVKYAPKDFRQRRPDQGERLELGA
jgi:hypothetical protein